MKLSIWVVAPLAWAIGTSCALAQNTGPPTPSFGAPPVVIVDPTNSNIPLGTPSNPLNVSGVSVATVGGFSPGGSYTGITSVTSTNSDVLLPAGTSVAVYNIGANAACVRLGTVSNVAASCAPGSSPSVTGGDVVPAGGSCGFVVGANTYLGAITASGTAQLILSGGTGLTTNACGAGGGGTGGGAVTAVSGAFAAGSVASGGLVDVFGVTPWDGLSSPSGTVTTNNALISIYEALLNPGKVIGNAGGVMDAVIGAALPPNALQAGVNTGGVTAAQHICGSQVFKHITTATDTQIVAQSGSKTIYVCDYSFSFGGTGNFYLEKATTGTCATLTQISQVWYGAANVAKTDANANYRGLNTGASAQLCANTSASASLDITVYYDQY
jgi:hypothetical protein